MTPQYGLGYISDVWRKWTRAPGWLRILAVVGVTWFLILLVIGAPLLLTEGPGLPLIWLGAVGLAPAGWIALRDDQPGRAR